MENNSEIFFMFGTLLGGALSLVGMLRAYRERLQKRTRELNATAAALKAHYEALNAIVDDPALPIEALETLNAFTNRLTSKQFCETFADRFMVARPASYGPLPSWLGQLESLIKTRPDLIANYHKAISSGLVALFLRRPSTAQKFEQLMADMAADGRREYAIADRITKMKQLGRDGNSDDGHIPRGMVAA
jgi:hypothetical protein